MTVHGYPPNDGRRGVSGSCLNKGLLWMMLAGGFKYDGSVLISSWAESQSADTPWISSGKDIPQTQYTAI